MMSTQKHGNICKYLVILLMLCCQFSYAKTVTLHDLAGREVQVSLPVERIFLANSNYLPVLDLVSADSYFNKIVGWDDAITLFFPDLADAYFARYPQLKEIPVLSRKNISVESVIKLKPDLLLASYLRYADFKSNGTLKQLEASGITVIFVDFYSQPIEDSIKSITLLGQLLDNTERATAFIHWYSKKNRLIADRIKQVKEKPGVLFERNAGVMGKEGNCCSYFGSGHDGKFVTLAGGNNLLAGVVPAAGGEVSLETVLTLNPQYYILTGADWSYFDKHSQSVPLGYQADQQKAQLSLQVLASRQGLGILDAIKSQRMMVFYEGFFYDTPLNILNTEALAKFLQPELFSDVDVVADTHYVHDHFMSIPATGVFWLRL